MMIRKRIILCLVLGAAIAVGISIPLLDTSESHAYRQVKKVAPAADNPPLLIGNHISNSPRPDETFDFPIQIGQQGPSQSLYSGPSQYPFYCMSLDSDLGQPLIDNQQGYGVPVYQLLDERKHIIGYSKDCALNSRLSYYSINAADEINKLPEGLLTNPAALTGIEGKLFRVEQGTINRFIYTLVVPIAASEIGARVAKIEWNKRLIYQFNGGTGLGFRQGRQRPAKLMERLTKQLTGGYAVISSSGNKTSYGYNMLLAEDTARRVKRQFTSLYGDPLYTVGIGGSGGGLAQYVIGQNSTGILDGLIPLYSYPDMITQTTYALDCDLLNNYFAFRAENKRHWKDWRKRQWVEGMNALNDFPQRIPYLLPVNQIMAGFAPSLPTGNSECINGYFGLSSYINNPKQGFLRDFFHPDVVDQVNWSYWQDVVTLLGTDSDGFGRSTWDNVGVQYGLTALQDGRLTIDDFIDLNSKIGGWKPQTEMQEEVIITPLGRKIPLWLSLWGNHNISDIEHQVAPRHAGSIAAMQSAYRSGQVFVGKLSLPIIDVRHYLENDLNMHHVSASFYSRLRLIQANGQANNHVIWIAHKDFSPVNDAFVMMDEWLLNKKDSSLADSIDATIEAKPDTLLDSCFAADARVVHQGEGVWDGEWNNKKEGECQKLYPMYSNSRIQAGGPWAGDLFKCQLMPVQQALSQGLYGKIDMSRYQQQLEQIFPEGVCDYSKTDAGRPDDLLAPGQPTIATSL